MQSLMDRLEKKFGRYAIPNLTRLLILCYVIGYLLQMIRSDIAAYMMLEPGLILKGQVWRIVTWIVIPPANLSGSFLSMFFLVIMLFFYLSIGRSLELAWGNFRYNVYIFGGMLITVIAAFACNFIFSAVLGKAVSVGPFFSTYYIMMSIFLAFAATFPDAQVLLYFVIPVKVKWLGILYAAFLLYDCVGYFRLIASGNIYYLIPVIAVLASLLNFIIFFFTMRKRVRLTPQQKARQREYRMAMEEQKRKFAENAQRANARASKPARHRCEVCGRTELDDPSLEFRFCTKCDGNHEYCMEHLYTHEHIRE